MKLLVLIPVKRNMHEALRLRCFQNVLALQTYFQGQVDICLDERGPGDSLIKDWASRERIANLVAVRQGMVNDYLRPEHTHVLMVDADVDYEPRVVAEMLRTSMQDIVAPAVLAEGTGGQVWYDTWGFIDQYGRPVRQQAPFFYNTDRMQQMLCVGTFYLVPAELFRQGAKYEVIGGYVDHMSVCVFAREHGRKVLCNLDIDVDHPALADFGEERF